MEHRKDSKEAGRPGDENLDFNSSENIKITILRYSFCVGRFVF